MVLWFFRKRPSLEADAWVFSLIGFAVLGVYRRSVVIGYRPWGSAESGVAKASRAAESLEFQGVQLRMQLLSCAVLGL